MGTDLGPYRACEGTYGFYPPSSMPALPPLDGTFSWLDTGIDPDIEYVGVFSRSDLPAGLPPSFVDFVRKPALTAAIPSCTACWWEEALPFLPLEDGTTLVRFLNDQQGCLFWYLHLFPDGTHRIVCGDAEDPDSLIEVAPEFEQFLYRYWVENLAWFLIVDFDEPWDDLPPHVRSYLSHYSE